MAAVRRESLLLFHLGSVVGSCHSCSDSLSEKFEIPFRLGNDSWKAATQICRDKSSEHSLLVGLVEICRCPVAQLDGRFGWLLRPDGEIEISGRTSLPTHEKLRQSCLPQL